LPHSSGVWQRPSVVVPARRRRFRGSPPRPQDRNEAAEVHRSGPVEAARKKREVPTAERSGRKTYCRWAAGAALALAGTFCLASGASADAGSRQVVRDSAVPIVSALSLTGPASNSTTMAAATASSATGPGATKAAPPAGLVPQPAWPAWPARPAGPDNASLSATTVSSGEREVAGAAVIAPGGLWSGGPLQAAIILSVPTAVGVLVIAFIVLQWLVDRRDPTLVEAPVRRDHDSVGFE
jgi:hypothetical protein